MKPPIFAPLVAALAFASCETAHKAAVSTFRVVDAPAQYVRRKLGVDEENQQTTTTETSVQSGAAMANPPTQPYPAQQPPPPSPVRSQAPAVTTAQQPSVQTQPKPQPTATPRVVKSENPPPANSTAPSTAAVSQTADLPYAKPVPGKPGYVFSPFDKNGGYVDVTGYSPGQKVKDPYSGRIFLVP
jgi:outer membrane biosynthesis protein TonB